MALMIASKPTKRRTSKFGLCFPCDRGAHQSCKKGPCKCDCFPSLKRRLKVEAAAKQEAINHPAHYGGADDPYEAIKVIEAWDLGFHLGNTVKYISRAGRKPGEEFVKDLKKARWYLDRKIAQLERSAR